MINKDMFKRLGQHFLKDKSILKRIIQALDVREGDVVVEIGPGHGELTNVIVEKFKNLKCKDYKIIAIEKDKNLARELEKENIKNLKIIEGDALKVLPELSTKYRAYRQAGKIQNAEYKLVGNIPYYITGHLLRIIGELGYKPSKTVLLIQKEVAQRICALPPHSSLLSLSVQFWADCKIIEIVSKKYFSPPPKVESAVIELATKKDSDKNSAIAAKYYAFVKKAFKQPRKTLLNNLINGGYTKEEALKIINKLKLQKNDRPQILSSEAISSLF